MFRVRFLAIVSAIAVSMPLVHEARAQPSSGQDVATAQALFDDAKRLMGLGKHSEACPKLVESQRLDPGGGTLFAIALCHEREGKTASAWADFNVALTEARKDRRADREAAAAEHARALEAKLTRIRVVAPTTVAQLEIRRDGARVGEAQWDTALPVDPGEHVFEATAPGKTPWKQVVDARGEGATIDVTVPILADEPVAKPAPPPAPPPVTQGSETAPPPPAPSEASSQRTWAVIAGTAGLVVTGVGLGFGLSAKSQWNEADDACPARRCKDPLHVKRGEDAGTTADVSTTLVVVGAVGIAAGIVLWLTAPSASDPKRALNVMPMATTRSLGLEIGGTL